MTHTEMIAALQANRLRPLEVIAREAWQDIGETFRLCQALDALRPQEGRAQKRAERRPTEQLIRSIREKTLRLEPQMLARIGGYYEQFLGSNSIPVCAIIFLGTEAHALDQAARFFLKFHQAKAQMWGGFARQEPGIRQQYIGLNLMFGMLVSYRAQTPTWKNFLRAVIEENKHALKAFKMLFTFYGLMEMEVGFQPEHSSPVAYGPIPQAHTLRYFLGTNTPHDRIVLPVPAGMEQKLVDLSGVYADQAASAQERQRAALTWFADHELPFSVRKTAMWRALTQEPRLALREGGLDKVRLDVESLTNNHTQYNMVQFFPLDQFPQVRVRLWASFLDEDLYAEFIMTSPDLEASTASEHNRILERLLAYISVECYWRIVCDQIERPARRAFTDAGEVLHPPRKKNKASSHRRVVRARFRHLPEGHQASFEAAQAAIEHPLFRRGPPPGMTFVRQYNYGHDDDVLAWDPRPLFVYHGEDLGYQRPDIEVEAS